MLKKYLLVLFLIFAIQPIYADDDDSSVAQGPTPDFICSEKTCPYISRNKESLISINCKDLEWYGSCDITYKNDKGATHTEPDGFHATSDTQIFWLTPNLAQIFDFFGQYNTDSMFVDFDRMSSIYIQNAFAVNANQQIVAYDQNKLDKLQISKIFDPKVRVFISIKEIFSASMQVITPDTKFDEKENLQLVYSLDSIETRKFIKTIPIDYNWFKEDSNDKTVRCYEYKPDVSQQLTSITCPKS